MKEEIENLKQKALSQIEEASTAQALNDVRIQYLGKKGELTAILRGMGALSAEERPKIGRAHV